MSILPEFYDVPQYWYGHLYIAKGDFNNKKFRAMTSPCSLLQSYGFPENNQLLNKLQNVVVEAGAWFLSGSFLVGVFWFAASFF